MKIVFSIVTLVVCFSVQAECLYTIDSKDVEVKWTAFKTPKKLGVSGKFTSLGITGKKQDTSLSKILTSTKFAIDTSSITSGDAGRDQKIAKFFFGSMEGNKIEGKIQKLSKGILELVITMNNVTRTLPLIYTQTNSSGQAQGHIDMFDFSMNKSLKAINEACLALHEGKTWSDVAVELNFKYTKKCK